MGITLKLPFPPSTNTYYRSLRTGKLAGRVLVSQKGREYRAAVAKIVGKVEAITAPAIDVSISLVPPDARKRDLDNYLKAMLDALTHAGVWKDDSQITRLLITKCWKEEGGFALVEIRHE